MNLWIRSQDKELLLKVDEIYLRFEENVSIWSNNQFLGLYETEKRALEVLDEIQNAILGILSLEDIKERKIKKYTGEGIFSKLTNCLVYQMPKE